MAIAQRHLLVDKVDLKAYNTVKIAEMIGIELQGGTLNLCYTPKSELAPRLIEQCSNYKLDNPFKNVSFLGDFNVHNPQWIHSIGEKDAGGVKAEEMCEMLGYNQLIDFPTRGRTTLDLMMTPWTGSAVPSPGAGTSDHISINIILELQVEIPPVPPHKPTRMWQNAPWSHIKGDIKRKLQDWDPYTVDTVDDAEVDLDTILLGVIDTHVKWSKPKAVGPIVWWDESCQKAYKTKLSLFPQRFIKHVRYNAALNHSRTVQNRAFARYQKELSKKLESADKSDKSFWNLAKEIGGIESGKSSAAPPAEALAVHFAQKMSNGKDEEDPNFVPKDPASIPFSSFKIRHKRVRQVLQGIDDSKSANGIGPKFWKAAANSVSVAVTKLYKRMVREGMYPSRWKISSLHTKEDLCYWRRTTDRLQCW